MKRAYVDTPEGQIHYRTEGSGEPLLLLHQTALSSDEYSDVIPILSKRYQVVAMDTVGYGNSYLPPNMYTIEDYARSIIKFLDAMGIRKTSIVGHHTGATLAVETAVAYPERVDKLVLSGLPYVDQKERKIRQTHPKYGYMELKEDGSHLVKWWGPRRPRLSYLKLETLQRILVNYLNSGLGLRAEDGHKAIYIHDIEPRLPLIKCPTLLISGTEDVFYDRLEATKSLIPNCQTRIIEGAHIYPTWEKPGEFAQIVLEFLENPRA